MLKGISGTVLYVKDVRKSLRFWHDKLGFKVQCWGARTMHLKEPDGYDLAFEHKLVAKRGACG